MKKSVWFVLLLVGLFSALQAQNFAIHQLPTQQQLPVASVHCIMQDSEGYLWYGTFGGLCRDNGYQIDVFRPTDAQSTQEANKVHCIAESASGDIFFGTGDGLFVLSKRDYLVRRVEIVAPGTSVEALFTDSEGCLWVGTRQRIYCQKDGGWRDFANSSSVASFFEDSRGRLFVLLWGGGMLLKQKGEEQFSELEWPQEKIPLQMLEDVQHQCFWVLTSGEGILRMQLVEGKKCLLVAQPATMGSHDRNHGLSLLRDSRHGLLWESTLDNLYAYSIDADGQLHEYPLKNILPNGNKILDQLFESRDGCIYVSGFTPHTFVISSPQSDIRRLAADDICRQTGFPVLSDRAVYDGSYIWIWQGRQGLMLYDIRNDRAARASRKFDRTIQRSSLGGIWASDGSQLFRLWQSAGQVRQEEVALMPAGGRIRCLFEADEQSLFVATDSCLERMSLVGRQLQKVADLPAVPVDMAADRQGNVYLALAAGGLCRVSSKGQVERIDQTAESFLSVCTMADGSLWASTYEGNVYHTSADGQLSREPLLCSREAKAIKCIRADGLGHVWTLTDQQVCEYAPQSRAFRIIGNDDPFIDVSYFYALEPIDAGSMCLGGAGALIQVQSSGELSQQTAVGVVPQVASVLVDGQTRFVGKGSQVLSLAADEQDITLLLTTLDHLHASDVSFAYQIEGITRDWVYLPQGSNSIILTNLGKGSHTLHVMATDRYGCWSAPQQVLDLRRAAFWYETGWAYLLYIGMALLLAYAVFRLERRIHLLRRLIRRKSEVRLDEIEIRREDIAEQQRNDDFLRRVVALIEENLSRTDYSVEQLSSDMCMSRITLYRRMQEQTGQTPTDFMRDIRLKKAALLLVQSPEATIADVARKVGFATPKYFSRCFKEKFGVLPREYHPSEGASLVSK